MPQSGYAVTARDRPPALLKTLPCSVQVAYHSPLHEFGDAYPRPAGGAGASKEGGWQCHCACSPSASPAKPVGGRGVTCATGPPGASSLDGAGWEHLSRSGCDHVGAHMLIGFLPSSWAGNAFYSCSRRSTHFADISGLRGTSLQPRRLSLGMRRIVPGLHRGGENE